MSDFLSNAFEWLVEIYLRGIAFGWGILFSLAGVLPFAVLLYLIWLLVSSSQRRQHRARSFIDLIQIGLKQGCSVEQTILSLSAKRVQDLGVRFHLLAAWLERGYRLSAALAEVRRFLPAQISAMLRVGEEIGDIGRVLPVCRATLKDAPSQTQKNLNNVVVLLFALPVTPALVWFLSVFVFPKLEQIMQDMLSAEVPPAGGPVWSSALFDWSLRLANVSLAIWLLFLLGISLPGAGAWLLRWINPGWSRLVDSITFRIPWARWRMQRNFSAMLALLLDAGMPEDKSIRLAARGAANETFSRRAERAVHDLSLGTPLTEAVRWVDHSGEFRWRLRNVSHQLNTRDNFATALAGWHLSLEAKAFQREQAASQAITTGMVLLNGLTVGLATVGVFQALTTITEAALW